MRRQIVPVIAALAALAIVVAGAARARPNESFTLERHDKIIAEAAGCYADCRAVGSRRTCTVNDYGCRVVCQTLPECRTDQAEPLRVCAIVRDRP